MYKQDGFFCVRIQVKPAFAERDKCKPVLLGLSLAGNLVKPLLSLYGTEWRERGYGLGRFQIQGGENWILPQKINANRFFWDSHWLEIYVWDRIEVAWLWTQIFIYGLATYTSG
jgi:hypothetical protein